MSVRNHCTLTIPGKPLTQNDMRRLAGRHWTATKKAQDAHRTAAKYELLTQWRQPHKIGELMTWPVTVTVADHCRTGNLRDTEACAPTVKIVLDLLTRHQFWPDDSPAYCARIIYLPPIKTGVDELVVTIESSPT